MEYRFRFAGRDYPIRLERSGETLHAEVGGRKVAVRLLRQEAGVVDLEVAGRRRRVYVAPSNRFWCASFEGIAYKLERSDPSRKSRAAQHTGHGLEARMPGVVRSVPIAVGDRVERGATLILLEAMKMEIRVTAPAPGRVARICCREGEQVDRGQVLVELTPESENP